MTNKAVKVACKVNVATLTALAIQKSFSIILYHLMTFTVFTVPSAYFTLLRLMPLTGAEILRPATSK